MLDTRAKTRITAEQAVAAAQDFVADNLGDLVGTGQPCRMLTVLRSTWVVPLILTSPGYGVVGTVGVVTVDDEVGSVVGWTPVNDIRENAERISRDRKSELEAAFQQAWQMNQSRAIVISSDE